jgi:hypothetical protein
MIYEYKIHIVISSKTKIQFKTGKFIVILTEIKTRYLYDIVEMLIDAITHSVVLVYNICSTNIEVIMIDLDYLILVYDFVLSFKV